MPDGDGTGPRWAQGWRCRRGFGRPMGFGPRGRYYDAQSGDEISQLKAYAGDLSKELEEVKRRISTMEKS